MCISMCIWLILICIFWHAQAYLNIYAGTPQHTADIPTSMSVSQHLWVSWYFHVSWHLCTTICCLSCDLGTEIAVSTHVFISFVSRHSCAHLDMCFHVTTPVCMLQHALCMSQQACCLDISMSYIHVSVCVFCVSWYMHVMICISPYTSRSVCLLQQVCAFLDVWACILKHRHKISIRVCVCSSYQDIHTLNSIWWD